MYGPLNVDDLRAIFLLKIDDDYLVQTTFSANSFRYEKTLVKLNLVALMSYRRWH
jgi:hypothetical protein